MTVKILEAIQQWSKPTVEITPAGTNFTSWGIALLLLSFGVGIFLLLANLQIKSTSLRSWIKVSGFTLASATFAFTLFKFDALIKIEAGRGPPSDEISMQVDLKIDQLSILGDARVTD